MNQPEPSGRAGAYLILGVLYALAGLADVIYRCRP